MNRRNLLTALMAAVAWFLAGRRKYGKASPKAVAISHNGIISKDRTPWLIGCKVYVNGRLVKRAISVNTTKGYVLAYGEDDGKSLDWLNSKRIYGWIEIDDSDCMTQQLRDPSRHSV